MADRGVIARGQRAEVAVRVGKRFTSELRVEISSGGLLAIGGLVAMILLSTAVLVAVTTRGSQRRFDGRRPDV